MYPRSIEDVRVLKKGRLLVLKLKKDGFLNSAKVGQWLGYSTRTVTELAQQWHDSGGSEGIPAFKIGRAWRFDPDQLETWLAAKQQPANLESVNKKTRSVA